MIHFISRTFIGLLTIVIVIFLCIFGLALAVNVLTLLFSIPLMESADIIVGGLCLLTIVLIAYGVGVVMLDT